MNTMNGIEIDLTVEQVRNMNLPQLRAEAKSRWDGADAIDMKHGGMVTPDKGEDYHQQRKLLAEVDLINTRLGEVEDAEGRSRMVKAGRRGSSTPAESHDHGFGDEGAPGDGQKSIITMFGAQFTNDAHYKSLIQSGAIHNPSVKQQFDVELKGSLLAYLARKALVYSASGSGGNLINPQRLPGFQEYLQRQLTLLDLIPSASTTSNTIEYVKELAPTFNAAEVAEATVTTGVTGLKPESAIGFEEASSTVRTIAHWVPVTNAMLADAPQIRGVIDNRLLYGLNLRLETQILGGNGTPPNLQGILGSGIQTLGLSAGSTYGGSATVVDAAYAAMVQVQVTGLASPNGFVFNPIDWAAVRLSRENAATGTYGGYQYGPPSVSGPMTLWGRPVVEAIGMTENTLLTGDFQLGCMLFDREQAAIRVGTINDQFVRNLQTILAELRAAFVVFRPTAFARVTGA